MKLQTLYNFFTNVKVLKILFCVSVLGVILSLVQVSDSLLWLLCFGIYGAASYLSYISLRSVIYNSHPYIGDVKEDN